MSDINEFALISLRARRKEMFTALSRITTSLGLLPSQESDYAKQHILLRDVYEELVNVLDKNILEIER